MNIRRIIFQVLAYCLYGLVAFAVFLYVMFPYEQLRQRLVDQVSQGAVQLEIARLKPTFPPGLAMRNVRLSTQRQNAPEEVVQYLAVLLRDSWCS